MALRLTGTTTAPSAPPALDPTQRVAQLTAHARTALGAGDLCAYRELLDEAAAIEDPQRAYQATLQLLEQGLLAANHASDSLATRIYVALADAALTALERTPAEPILLNTAGIACYELWSLDAARALFAATRRLDPSHADAERNLSEVARRGRGPRPRRPLHPVAVGLARRAEAVARRARARVGMTVSLCMIVKDEQERLGECLAAAAPAVDEIIVVDTGSTDRTIEIARAHGATVIEREWTGDFAAARNVSLEAATSDWILWLDADEVIVAGDAPRLRSLLGRTWQEAIYLVETSFTGELGDGTAFTHNALRLLRNRPAYRFEGRIHEQIQFTLPSFAPGRIGFSPVRIEHYGYLGKVRAAKEKFTRNAELLRRQAAEGPADAFLHHNLGAEYGAIGDYAAAAEEFGQAWSMLEHEQRSTIAEFAPATLLGLVKTLRATGRPEESTAKARAGLERFPDFADLVYEQAITALSTGNREGARADYAAAIAMGDAPARYGGMVGTGSYWPRAGLAMLALEDDDPGIALEHLGWCLEHAPSFQGAAAGYITARLREGATPAEALAEVRRRMTLRPRAQLAVGLALQRAGERAAAETELVALLGETQDADVCAGAQLALAELRLGAGDLAGAAQAAGAVAPDDRRGALARRIELCARIADGELDAAAAVLANASLSGLPSAERTAFAAWLALAGGTTPPALGLAGVPLLAALLEILLPVGATIAAAQLRRLITDSTLPERERRQLLAETALRHGDLAVAAAEWMTVCASAPDARALIGLAQVALGHGLPADAATFARGALEVEPGCPTALAVLAAVDPVNAPPATPQYALDA